MTDRGGAASRFDPRFDPAFQPGYDPRNDPGAAARVARKAQPAPMSPVDAAPVDSAPVDSAPVDSAPVAASPAEERPIAAPDAEGTDDAAPRHGFNPFLAALWVVSAVLLASGAGLLRSLPSLEESVRTSSQSSDYFMLQALVIGSPQLIVLGLATAIGVLFVHAVRWGRRGPL